MSTAVEEGTSLEDMLTEGPPCEIKYWQPKYTVCGEPSVIRIRFSCVCGDVTLRFVCSPHYEKLKAGELVCRVKSCRAFAGSGLSWTVVLWLRTSGSSA